MRFNLLFSFLFVWCSGNLFAQNSEDVLTVKDKKDFLWIGKHISFLEDTKGNMTIKEVLQAENQKKFIKNTTQVFSRPATPSAFWFKITLQNQTQEDLLIETGGSFACWFIDFYKQDSLGNFYKARETGALRPNSQKEYDVNFYWLTLAKAQENQVKTYYLRMQSDLPPEYPFRVGTLLALYQNKNGFDYMVAGFVGLMFVMALYNLFLALATRNNIYIIYVAYMFTATFVLIFDNNYPFSYHPFWWNYFFVWQGVFLFLLGFFARSYLNLAQNIPLMDKILKLFMLVLGFIFPLLNIFGIAVEDLVNPFQVILLLYYTTLLSAGFYLWYKGHKNAYYYVIGWAFALGSVFVLVFVVNGIMPFTMITRNLIFIGFGLEALMFSWALGDTLNIMRKEKEIAQLKLVEMVKEQNQLLESKVQERTAEIIAQTQKLEQINATKDKLFAIIGHDLRSPIDSLRTILDLVMMRGISQQELLDLSGKLQKQVSSIHFTLNNLLQWANAQMLGIVPNNSQFDLYELSTQNINLLNSIAKDKNISFNNLIPENTYAYADAEQVNVVMRNLISNALKFTPDGGMITIKAIPVGIQYKVIIEDTGIGIATNKQHHIFTSHHTSYGTQGEKGTGLGLSLCKDFIEMNGGQIGVESQLGKGSNFYFTINTFLDN